MKNKINVRLPYTKFPTVEELVEKVSITLNSFVFYTKLVFLKISLNNGYIKVYLVFDNTHKDGTIKTLEICGCKFTAKNYKRLQDKIHKFEFQNNVSLDNVDVKHVQEIYQLFDLRISDKGE